MSNLKNDIAEALGYEPIEAIVISRTREESYDWGEDAERPVQQWRDVAPILNYNYDSGYGGVDCHRFVAWTATRIAFLGQYDGCTWVETIPRNPQPLVPEGVGGG